MLLSLALAIAAAQPAPDVAVAIKPIARGAEIELQAVEIHPRGAVELPKLGRPLAFDAGVHVRARRNLRPGEVILEADVEPVPEIAAGDRVLLTVVKGRVHVTGEVIAKEDGAEGQTIWLENPTSKRRLRAKVIGPGRAELTAEVRR